MSQVEHRAERSFAIKGTLVFTAQRDQFTIMEDAYLVCEGKKVAGAYDTLPDRYRQVDVLDMGGKFVIPGTCDIHVHASQASFQGIGQNIESGQWNTWFDRYAFPDESRFNDIAYAEQAYTRFVKSLLATPTTRLCAYATTSREATEILMKVLAKYGFAGYVGKVNMDRNSSAGRDKERNWCDLSDSHAAIFSQLYGKLPTAVGTACRRIPCPGAVAPFRGAG